MSPEIMNAMLAFSLFLLACSIAMSVYLLYDLASGNARRHYTATLGKEQAKRGKESTEPSQ